MSKTTFRTLIIVMWMLTLASYVARALDANMMSTEFRAEIAAVNAAGMPLHVGMYYLLTYFYAFLFLVSTIGLFAFRNWARYLYLSFYLIGFGLALLPTLTVYDRAHIIFGGLYALVSALILSLIFLSPVKSYFVNSSTSELL
ncbi:MAG: hypothetical protein LC754_16020 [Acidobacteria bacterium]|nr:hypothetical protein [Acidobacteriota bacterium]